MSISNVNYNLTGLWGNPFSQTTAEVQNSIREADDVRQLTQFVANRFIWDTGNNNIPSFLPEILLLSFGSIGIFKGKDGKKVIGTGGFYGEIDKNGMPTNYRMITPNGEEYNGKVNTDCIVCGNNSFFAPDTSTIYRFANMLTQTDVSMLYGLWGSRNTRYFLADSDKDKLAIQTAIKKTQIGEPVTIVSPTADSVIDDILDGQKNPPIKTLEFTDPADTDKLQYLSRFADDILSRFLCRFGIDVGNVNKGSQILENEVNRLAEASSVPLFEAYQSRMWGMQNYAKVFGDNDITVKVNSLYGNLSNNQDSGKESATDAEYITDDNQSAEDEEIN